MVKKFTITNVLSYFRCIFHDIHPFLWITRRSATITLFQPNNEYENLSVINHSSQLFVAHTKKNSPAVTDVVHLSKPVERPLIGSGLPLHIPRKRFILVYAGGVRVAGLSDGPRHRRNGRRPPRDGPRTRLHGRPAEGRGTAATRHRCTAEGRGGRGGETAATRHRCTVEGCTGWSPRSN